MTTPLPDKQPADETLEEIAEQCAPHYLFHMGAAATREARAKLIANILSALRNERSRAFDQGYVCATANVMRLHGEEVIAREVLNQNRPSDWSIIEKEDFEALRPVFEHEAALAEIEVLRSYQAIREGK